MTDINQSAATFVFDGPRYRIDREEASSDGAGVFSSHTRVSAFDGTNLVSVTRPAQHADQVPIRLMIFPVVTDAERYSTQDPRSNWFFIPRGLGTDDLQGWQVSDAESGESVFVAVHSVRLSQSTGSHALCLRRGSGQIDWYELRRASGAPLLRRSYVLAADLLGFPSHVEIEEGDVTGQGSGRKTIELWDILSVEELDPADPAFAQDGYFKAAPGESDDGKKMLTIDTRTQPPSLSQGRLVRHTE